MNLISKVWYWITDPFVFRIMNLVVFIFYFVPSDYNMENVPMKVCFAWGVFLLAKDLLTKRNMFKQPYWYVLLLLCVSYGLSILTNFPVSSLNNIYNLIYLATNVFLFYSFDLHLSKEDTEKKMTLLNDVAISLIFILALLSLGTFIFDLAYTVPTGTEGVIARQGFVENRLFGLYTSPNMGSMFGYVSVILALINNYFKRGTWKKFQKFYIVNAVVQYLYYVLSSSRGTQITLVAFMVFVYIILAYKVILSKQNVLKKISRNFVVLSSVFFAFMLTNEIVESGMSYVPSAVSYLIAEQGPTEVRDENGEMVIIEKKRPFEKVVIQHDEEGAEVSSGRLTIWAAALELVEQKPLFGVADADVYRSGELSSQIDVNLLSDLDQSELRRAHGNMHNTYVAVLVKAGIVGFLILTLFVVLLLKDNALYISRVDSKLEDNYIQMYVIVFAFLLSLFVNDAVENHLIFNNRDVIGLIFWTYLGFLNYLRFNSIEKVTN